MEKMLMTLALDERDFIKQKLAKEISEAKFYTVCRKKDPKTSTGTGKQDFIDNAKSTIQSIKDKVERLNRLEAAITRSNAEVKVKINGREMSVAEAIALKNNLAKNNYAITLLCIALKNQRSRASDSFDLLTEKVKENRDELIKNITAGSDKSVSIDDLTKSIEASTDLLTPQLIGPFTKLKDSGEFDLDDAAEKALFEELDTSELEKEINTAIKISNATTEIEF